MGMIQPNFGIHPSAMAVMALLQNRNIEPSWDGNRYTAEVNAAPWYNGREQGIVFYMRDSLWKRQINCVVYEHRNSDNICVLVFEAKTFNPPTLADIPDGVYKDKWDVTESFSYNQHLDAAEYINGRLNDFWIESMVDKPSQ